MKLLLTYFLLFSLTLFAADRGSVDFFLFLDGKPIIDTDIEIDNKITYKSDDKGSLRLFLDEGSHTVTIKEGKQALASSRFKVIADENTQLIFTLYNNKEAKIDIELSGNAVSSEALANKRKEDEKKPKGTFVGAVVSSEKGEAIADAKVFVKGRPIESLSSEKGVFELTLPEGNYTISVIHPNFSTQNSAISIFGEETTSRTIELTPASLELAEFVVLVPHIEGSVAALVEEAKKSNAIAEILGGEQMSKKGDSSAAGALKRVTGLTLVGKNIYVRGLGERYANIQLNGLILPSPDPTKRVVPLDIFPSGVIGSIKVQKTFTSDIPGSFGGGFIDIRTKKDSSSDYLKISSSVKMYDATFGDRIDYAGSATDWTGHDDGLRSVPSSVLSSATIREGERPPVFNAYARNAAGEKVFPNREVLLDYAKELALRNINVKQNSVPLSQKMGIEFSKTVELTDEDTLSMFANYSYSQDHNYIEMDYNTYELLETGELDLENSGVIKKSSSSVKHGGMFNVGYKHADRFDIRYTKLYLLNSAKTTRQFVGDLGSDNEAQQRNFLQWQERELDINQLLGNYHYELITPAHFQFGFEHATANLYQPSNIKYGYIDYNRDGIYELESQSGTNLIYENVTSDDVVDNFFFKNKFELNLFSENDFLEVGYDRQDKTRESRMNKFFFKQKVGAISAEDVTKDVDTIMSDNLVYSDANYSTAAFALQTLFEPSDYFDAELKESSTYLNTLFNPSEMLEVMFGVRQVALTQTLYLFAEGTGRLIERVPNTLLLDKSLPSLSVKYKLDEENQLKFAYTQTYIYPDFREFSSNKYDHPEAVATVIGNPNLTHTDIDSVDGRYEHYISPRETLSGALFYKQLKNPIEDTQQATTSLPIYSFMNSQKADLAGIELDGNLFLGVLDSALDDFYVSGNYTYIYSNVTVAPEMEAFLTSNNRPLQGLSPQIVNMSIGYDDTTDRSITLSYNKMAERLMRLGLKNGTQAIPDDYEIPPHLLNLVWIEKFENGLKLSVKFDNLIDDKTQWQQDGKISRSYKMGRSVSIGASYKY
jgi:TonB-dependent receptor